MLEYAWAIQLKVNSLPIEQQYITPYKFDHVFSDTSKDDDWMGQANEIKKSIVANVQPIKRQLETSQKNNHLLMKAIDNLTNQNYEIQENLNQIRDFLKDKYAGEFIKCE